MHQFQWAERLREEVSMHQFPSRQLSMRLRIYPEVEIDWPEPPKTHGTPSWHLAWIAEHYPNLLAAAVSLHLRETYHRAIRAACIHVYSSLGREVYLSKPSDLEGYSPED